MSESWPRVSTVLRDMGLKKPLPDLPQIEWGRARGQAVHRAIQLYEAGTLDQGRLHRDVVGPFRAYLSFKERESFKMLTSEEPVSHPQLRYRGTLDQRGTAPDPLDINDRVIVDFKCGKPDLDACAYQVAAYAMAVHPHCLGNGWCVTLGDEGYRVHDLPLYEASETFKAAVRVWWAQREGIPKAYATGFAVPTSGQTE